MPKKRILILDAETRSTLASVRALANSNLEIAICSHSKWALAAASKYTDITFKIENPKNNPKEYCSSLIKLIASYKPQMLIPTTDESLNLCYSIKEELIKYCVFPFPEKNTYEKINNKFELLEIAKKHSINVPETMFIPEISKRNSKDIEAIKNFSYPAVLKPVSTTSIFQQIFIKPEIYYPITADEALLKLSEKNNNHINYLLQQRITGSGTGFFALCKKGEPYAIFAHKRVLEKPPSGGVSVLSESIPLEEAPIKESLSLLKELSWDGVAMLEYKRDLLGKPYLMEINPRFWGSLQLSINCGINFPFLLHKLFLGESLELQKEYSLNQRLRWEIGTFDHFFINLRKDVGETIKNIFQKNSLEFFIAGKVCQNEVFKLNDPFPFFYEILYSILG